MESGKMIMMQNQPTIEEVLKAELDRAKYYCRAYIDSVDSLEWKKDPDEVFNFLAAGIDITVERLRRVEKSIHDLIPAQFKFTPPPVEPDAGRDAP